MPAPAAAQAQANPTYGREFHTIIAARLAFIRGTVQRPAALADLAASSTDLLGEIEVDCVQ